MLAAVITVVSVANANAQIGYELLKDINTGTTGSNPFHLTDVNGILFFEAFDGTPEESSALYKSDGSEPGTELVADFNDSPFRTINIGDSIVVDDLLYFSAAHDNSGNKLFVSDGTEAGTRLVFETDGFEGPFAFQRFGDEIFFFQDSDVFGTEPHITDGTTEGTRLVLDIDGTSFDSVPDGAESVVHDGHVYFPAWDIVHGIELWRTDGTPEGTEFVAEMRPGNPDSRPQDFLVFGDSLYFTALVGLTERQLFKTDGTEEGTEQVSMLPDVNSQDPVAARLMEFDGEMYFVVSQSQLWKSDGTTEGTSLVADFSTSSKGSLSPGRPVDLTGLGDRLWFTVITDEEGRELWSTDGTPAGTEIFADLYPGPVDSEPTELTVFGNELYFAAENPEFGIEVWKTDGTPGSVTLLKDIATGRNKGSRPTELTVSGDYLFFAHNDGISSTELWRTDGTTEGTVLVRDIQTLPGSSAPEYFTRFDDRVFFAAFTGEHGVELWASDGTAQGTQQVLDLYPGITSSFPTDLNVLGDELFFGADSPDTGYELWKTDGTAENTVLVKDINPGPANSGFQSPAIFNGEYYFSTHAALNKTDGTEEGTVEVFVPNSSSAFVTDLTVSGGKLYFVARETDTGRELYVSDGTTEGTMLITDLSQDSNSSIGPQELTDVDGRLFFTHSLPPGSPRDRELFVSDGTPEGTMQVTNINPSSGNRGPENVTAFQGMAVFSYNTGANGDGLYKSDGTLEGLEQIFNPGPGGNDGYDIEEIVPCNESIFLVKVARPDSIAVYYQSDGTTEGTVPLAVPPYEIPSRRKGLVDLSEVRVLRTDERIPHTFLGDTADRPPFLYSFGAVLPSKLPMPTPDYDFIGLGYDDGDGNTSQVIAELFPGTFVGQLTPASALLSGGTAGTGGELYLLEIGIDEPIETSVWSIP